MQHIKSAVQYACKWRFLFQVGLGKTNHYLDLQIIFITTCRRGAGPLSRGGHPQCRYEGCPGKPGKSKRKDAEDMAHMPVRGHPGKRGRDERDHIGRK